MELKQIIWSPNGKKELRVEIEDYTLWVKNAPSFRYALMRLLPLPSNAVHISLEVTATLPWSHRCPPASVHDDPVVVGTHWGRQAVLLGSLRLIHQIGNTSLAAADKFWRAALCLQGFPCQEVEHRHPVLFSGAKHSFSPSLPYPTKIPWHSPGSRELGSRWVWCTVLLTGQNMHTRVLPRALLCPRAALQELPTLLCPLSHHSPCSDAALQIEQ